MGIFRNANESAYVGGRKHFKDVIKNSGEGGLLVWRAPEEDFNDGSTLLVMPGEAALFVRGGRVEQVFGEGTYTLSSENYPFLSRLRNMLTGGVSVYSCVVYFVRLADSAEILWGTSSPLQVRDKVLGVATKLRAHGSYKVAVRDPALLLERLIGNNVPLETQQGLERYFSEQFQGKIRALLTQELSGREGELLGVEADLERFSAELLPKLDAVLAEYGLDCVAFSVAALDVADSGLREEFDRIGMDNYRTISGYRTEGRAIDELGPKWAAIKQAAILEKSAENPAGPGPAGDLASVIAGTAAMGPMMQDAMGAVGGVVPGSFGWVAAGGAAQSQVASAGTTSRYTQVSEDNSGACRGEMPDAADRRARLSELKALLDDGLITEEDFAQQKARILEQL